jgi:hypothetical protein
LGLPKPIESFETVSSWSKGLQGQWGGDPLAEDPEKLRSLEAFCELVGKTPDRASPGVKHDGGPTTSSPSSPTTEFCSSAVDMTGVIDSL